MVPMEEPVDRIPEFDERLKKTFEEGKKKGKLSTVKGTFCIMVHEKAAWTVITEGPRQGIYKEMTDDEMDFMMITTHEIFNMINTPADEQPPGMEINFDRIIEDKKMMMEGDFDVYLRFIKLAEADSMLSIRGSAKDLPSKGSKSKKKGRRRLV